MNEPVILTYFAQNADAKQLTYLSAERIGVERCWKNARFRNSFPIVYQSRDPEQAGIDELIEDIKLYTSRLVLLHFSSHAGKDEILLQHGTAYPSGIAGYLGDNATNLKLVVLNGCSTAGQVDVLFAQGKSIQAVVATHCPISDARARDFAIAFHQKLSEGNTTIRQAYREGLNAVRIRHQMVDFLGNSPGQDGEETAWRGSLETGPTDETKWGLFVRDTGEQSGNTISILDNPNWWRLDTPTPITAASTGSNKLIRTDLAYTCDRTDYLGIFNDLLQPDGINLNSYICQHYLIVGEESTSPLGLTRKLVYEKITSQKNFEGKYYYSCDPMEIGKRINYIDLNRSHTSAARIMKAVYERIPDLQFPPSLTEDQLFANFLLAFSRWEFVIIAVRIRFDQLTAEVVAGIGQFMDQLDRMSIGKPAQARFLFFWNVSYRSAGLLDKFREKPVAQIIDLFASAPTARRSDTKGLWILNDQLENLDIPTYDDIDALLEDYLLNVIELDSTQKAAICQITDVKELENTLIKLIAEANKAGTAT